MEKKLQALGAADPGSDLFSVQALQRQHEAVERDLLPLGEKVRRARQAVRACAGLSPRPLRMPWASHGLLSTQAPSSHSPHLPLHRSLRQARRRDTRDHDHGGKP